MNSSAKNLLLEKARSLLLDAVGCMSCPIAPQLSEKLETLYETWETLSEALAAQP